MSKTWQEGKLGELIDLQTGFPFKSEQYTGESEDVRLLRGDNIIPGGLRWDNVQRWSNQDLDDYRHYWLQDGDLVIAMDRPWVNAGLKYARIEKWDLPSLLVQRVARLRANHNADAGFLYHIVGSYQFTQYLLSEQTGTSVPHISAKQICDYIFPLPPLPEQRKIAEILSTWDEAIALTGALIAALQTRKRALMQLLLTGEVRFPGFDAEWEEVQVKQLGKVSSGGTPDTTNSAYWDGDIMWCTPTEITAVATKYISETGRRITEEGLLNSSAVLLEPGSILLCTRATIGQMAINTVPMATNQGFKNLTLSGGSDARFIYYLLSVNKHELVRLANGSTFLELSKNDFEELAFTVPDAGEQMRIAEVLDTCDSEIEMYQQKMEILKTQKRGLMQQLLTGAVRVRV